MTSLSTEIFSLDPENNVPGFEAGHNYESVSHDAGKQHPQNFSVTDALSRASIAAAATDPTPLYPPIIPKGFLQANEYKTPSTPSVEQSGATAYGATADPTPLYPPIIPPGYEVPEPEQESAAPAPFLEAIAMPGKVERRAAEDTEINVPPIEIIDVPVVADEVADEASELVDSEPLIIEGVVSESAAEIVDIPEAEPVNDRVHIEVPERHVERHPLRAVQKQLGRMALAVAGFTVRGAKSLKHASQRVGTGLADKAYDFVQAVGRGYDAVNDMPEVISYKVKGLGSAFWDSRLGHSHVGRYLNRHRESIAYRTRETALMLGTVAVGSAVLWFGLDEFIKHTQK